jgi:hypothetical protein
MTMPTDERRADRRYALETGVEYKIVQGGQAVRKGTGRLVNISRGGLLFECAETIPPGSRIDLEVDWPAETHKVALDVIGQSVRSQGTRTAVKVYRSSFRMRNDAARGKLPVSAA